MDRALTSDEVTRLPGQDNRPQAQGKDRSAAERQKIRASGVRKKTRKQENPPVSPFMKGGGSEGGPFTKGGKEKSETADVILRQAQDDKPLLHYVFNQENTYETEFRGKKALGVRDLGKGEPADLVIRSISSHMREYFSGGIRIGCKIRRIGWILRSTYWDSYPSEYSCFASGRKSV